MPDKQNESKFVAMLERKGIVRKIGSEDDPDETVPDDVRPRPDTDLRSLFGTSADETVKVKPAAHQPVPGMPSPIIPNERPQATPQATPQVIPQVIPQVAQYEQPATAQPTEADRVEAFSNRFASYKDSKDWDEEPVPAQNEPYRFESPLQPPPGDDPTTRCLDIEELYSVLSLKSKRTDTIYLVEEYLKTLPESLPDDSRREIVGKIIAASGFDYDLLMGDGVLRVKMLKEYAERFAQYTDDYVSSRQAELDELEQQTIRVRRLIDNRRELHKKQFLTIEAEAQRLKDILTFISG